jgi:arsenate reductase (thioredoxin)
MTDKVFNVLFISTGNSVRSIIAEALLNQTGEGRFRAFSAGSRPVGQVNPLAIETLRKARINTDGLRSKSWSEFAAPDAPRMDLVFTLCDAVAGETCPLWNQHPTRAQWSIDNPAALSGTEEEILKAYHETLIFLKRRIDLLIVLPAVKIDSLALRESVA